MTDQNGQMVVNPTRQMGMSDFSELYGGGDSPDIPVMARDYVSSQWDRTGVGGRPEDFFTKLRIGQQSAAISAAPRSREGFSMAPTLGIPQVMPAPTPNALATRGVATGGQLATLQKDVVDPGDHLANPLVYDQGDTELVRSQFARGGGAAQKILLEHTYGGEAEGKGFGNMLTPEGKINYAGIKPVKMADDLTNNKAFMALASRDPEQASKVYKDLIGTDYAADFAEKLKQKTAMERDYKEGIRSQFMQGKMRRNPETGWLERKVSEPDPTNPLGSKREVWAPADPAVQEADIHYGKDSLGVPRQPTVMDKIPTEQKGQFFSEYQKHIDSGKGAREATTLALQSIPSAGDSVTSTVATLQKSKVTPSPGGPAPNEGPINPAALDYARNLLKNGTKTPHEADYVRRVLEHTNPVELRKLGFPDLADMAITRRVQQQGSAARKTLAGGLDTAQQFFDTNKDALNIMGGDLMQVGKRAGRGALNAPNRLATMFGSGPMYPWFQE